VADASSLQKQAFATGRYYLIDIDKVLEIYKTAGYNVEDDEADVPTNLQIGSENCFFTGDFIRRGDRYYEIVIVSEGFSWDEVENEDESPLEDDE
jgi:hypothetical protein